MASETADDSPDDKGVINPLAAIFETRSQAKAAPSARKFMTALPWSALAAASIFSLRILTVAHLNLSIALQLVALTNTAQVLLGLTVILFQPFLLVVAIYVSLVCIETLHDAIKSMRSKEPVNISGRSLLFIFLWPPTVVLAIAFSAYTPGLYILIGLILWTVQRAWIDSKPSTQSESRPQAKGKRRRGHRIFMIVIGVLVMGYGVGLLCLNDTPWLPPEQITLTNDAVMVGYVISTSSSELTILRNSDRSIITLPIGQIKDQVICQAGGQAGSNNLFVHLAWESAPKVPACPPGH